MRDGREAPMPDEGPISFAAHAAIRKMHTSGSSPSLEVKNGHQACRHRGAVEIDAEVRTVFCKACGTMIDPFDALLSVAEQEQRMEAKARTIEYDRKLQRGFYAAKKTEMAKRCRHTRTYPIGDGKVKCLRCDTVMEGPDA